MKPKYRYPVLLMFLVGSFSDGTLAADGKSYPGSMCVQYSGAGYDVNGFGGVSNNSSTDTLKVVCPIVKDQNGIQYAELNVTDPGQGEIQCRVLTHYREDATWKGAQTGLESSSNGDPSMIEFHYDNLISQDGAHSYIRCDIPKKLTNGSSFSINSYHVIEW